MSLYLGIGDIVDLWTGGGENLSEPIDITAINLAMNDNKNNINSLSSSSSLSINTFNNTDNSILGKPNLTRYSS